MSRQSDSGVFEDPMHDDINHAFVGWRFLVHKMVENFLRVPLNSTGGVFEDSACNDNPLCFMKEVLLYSLCKHSESQVFEDPWTETLKVKL